MDIGHDRVRIGGASLCALGAINVLNGAIASLLNAEKTYYMEHYMNTHWITVIFLFTGITTTIFVRTGRDVHLALTSALCSISTIVAIASFIADTINIWVLVATIHNQHPYGRNPQLQTTAMFIYSIVDMLLCFVAIPLCLQILIVIRRRPSRLNHDDKNYRSQILIAIGIVLFIVANIRTLLWMVEIVWLKQLGDEAQFLFLHYTIDEPVWNAINIAVGKIQFPGINIDSGIMIIRVGIRGTRLIMYTSMTIAAVSIYPTLVYLCVDYRWHSNVRMSQLAVHLPKPSIILECNLAIGTIHLLLLIITVVIQLHSITTNQSHMKLGIQLRRGLIIIGCVLLIGAGVIMTVDLVQLSTRAFYRIFYPTEQRLAFIGAIGGICCILSSVTPYILPVTFTILLMTAHSCLFMIAAYIYLAFNRYFSHQLCELFHFGRHYCRVSMERNAVWSHLGESLLAYTMLIVTISIAYVIGRLLTMHRLRICDLSLDEMRIKRRYEICIKAIGWISLIAGIIVFGLIAMVPATTAAHPLLTLHGRIYRCCITLSLIIYPIVQITTAHDIYFYPLRSFALCTISSLRFVDIITQLDYRNVGQDSGIAWSTASGIELISLGAHFTTILLCIALLDSALNRLPSFDFGDEIIIDPDKLLPDANATVGYRQLQMNDE